MDDEQRRHRFRLDIIATIPVLRAFALRFVNNETDASDLAGPVAASQIWSLRVKELQQSIDRLPRDDRDVVMAVMLEGLSYKAAAARLGCPIGTVKSRLSGGRALL